MESFLTRLHREPDILALSETRMEANHPPVSLPGYSEVHSFTKERKPGGVALLIKESLRYRQLAQYYLNFSRCEQIWISLDQPLANFPNIIIGAIYRHPKPSEDTKFTEELQNTLSQITKDGKNASYLET